MKSNENDMGPEESQDENIDISLVRQLDEKDSNVNYLEEMLRKSSELNSSKSVRLIDQQMRNIPRKFSNEIESVVLSCNLLGKDSNIQWKFLPDHIRNLDLSGNYLQSIDGIDSNEKRKDLESLSLSFNQIKQISNLPQWKHLCLIDLSYNILTDLRPTIQSLKILDQLRILYLHGNPLSLLVDYRVYVVDSLEKLNILDDNRITTEERFRSRGFSQSNEHPKDYSLINITFGNVENVPMINPSQNEWPIEVHRYQIRLQWFDQEKEKEKEEKEEKISFDKLVDFNEYYSKEIRTSYEEYKSTINFSSSSLSLTINQILPFRDFLFNGTNVQFIHQKSEYWLPVDPNEGNEQKKKGKTNEEKKEKKNEIPIKKKKAEDLSKLILRNDPIETVLAEFDVQLRPFLDGEYQISRTFTSPISQSTIPRENEQIIPMKTNKKKENSIEEKKRILSSKSNKEKDISKLNENLIESSIEEQPPLRCSIQFQLQTFINKEQI